MPNKILIVVDMQNDFITGALGSKDAEMIVPCVFAKVKSNMLDGHAVLFTRDTHQENYMDIQEGKKLPIPHCIEGTPGWEVIPELKDFATMCLDKPTFGSIDLPHLVASYDEIELCGVCTDICVVSNALVLKANHPEKKIVVDGRCCAGVSPERHKAALATMKSCQIEVIND